MLVQLLIMIDIPENHLAAWAELATDQQEMCVTFPGLKLPDENQANGRLVGIRENHVR